MDEKNKKGLGVAPAEPVAGPMLQVLAEDGSGLSANVPNAIQAVVPCGHVGKCMASPSSYASDLRGNYRTPSDLDVAKHAMRKLEEARAKDVEVHAANADALASNAILAEWIRKVMDQIKMPKEHRYRDMKSRAMYPKMISQEAGWISDIRRWVVTTDAFDAATHSYNRLKADYDRFMVEAEKKAVLEAGKADREKAEKIKKREQDMKLATIINRYGLDILSEWDDVLEKLSSKDRLLNLAIAMEDTRGDWSEGCYRVRDALFVPSTPQEEEVIRDVAPCCEDFEDGRVFRDTRWSYDAIYAIIADQQLMADAREARSHTERW